MKTFLTFFLIVISSWILRAQTCDITTNGVMAIPNSLAVGQTSNLVFSIYNDAGLSSCAYPAQSVQVYFSLPANGLAFHSIVSPAGGVGNFFNWVYDPMFNTVIGLNHTPIPDAGPLGQIGEINVTIRVVATTLGFYPQVRTCSVFILNYENGPGFPSNNDGNDNGTVALQITAPSLPIDLISFKASNKNCNQVELSWQTASEQNNDYMEILRSSDGKEFLSIGKIKGTNKSTVSSYVHFDENDLIEGQTYYYRIKQVDFDGRAEFFDIITLVYSCPSEDIGLDLYPNPAFDKVNVRLTGFKQNEIVDLVITNVVGEIVKRYNNISVNNVNELTLRELKAGVYNMKLMDSERSLTKRFIKID